MDSAPTDGSPVIAIAHDYLTQRGGAERVVLTLSDSFPGAVIHTSCFEPSQTYQEFGDLDVCTTFLDRIRPIRRDPRKGIALLAPAFTAHRVDADLVVASSSAWAHGVTTDAPVIVYCHAPARWLHSPQRYAPGGSGGSRALGLAATGLSKTLGLAVRRWDAAAMARASKVFVNSRAIATQVAEIYGIDAEVLAPPPALIADGPVEPINGLDTPFWLTVARLLPYKHVDVIVAAARMRPKDRFVIVGDGPLRQAIENDLPGNVQLITTTTDAQLRWAYQSAEALVACAHEDFGLTPLEAASVGTPTIALRALGHLDTVVEGITGLFFDEPNPHAISAALDQARTMTFNEEDLIAQAAAFGRDRFIERMRAAAAEVLTRG